MRELASNKEWKKWGETDPLFGVASWRNKNKEGTSPWTNEDFYKLGESDWMDFRRHWEMYGVGDESCLEIGCGAGRITMHHKTIVDGFWNGQTDHERFVVSGRVFL